MIGIFFLNRITLFQPKPLLLVYVFAVCDVALKNTFENIYEYDNRET